jgi:hypothetical protein
MRGKYGTRTFKRLTSFGVSRLPSFEISLNRPASERWQPGVGFLHLKPTRDWHTFNAMPAAVNGIPNSGTVENELGIIDPEFSPCRLGPDIERSLTTE